MCTLNQGGRVHYRRAVMARGRPRHRLRAGGGPPLSTTTRRVHPYPACCRHTHARTHAHVCVHRPAFNLKGQPPPGSPADKACHEQPRPSRIKDDRSLYRPHEEGQASCKSRLLLCDS